MLNVDYKGLRHNTTMDCFCLFFEDHSDEFFLDSKKKYKKIFGNVFMQCASN